MAGLVELIGPGGRCKVASGEVQRYLARKGWRLPEDDEDVETVEAGGDVIDYDSLGVKELKEMCREAGYAVSGTKEELIARLTGAEAQTEGDDE